MAGRGRARMRGRRGGLGLVRRGVGDGRLGFARRVVVGGRRSDDNLLLRFAFLDPGFVRGNVREGGVQFRFRCRGLVLIGQQAGGAGAGQRLQLLPGALGGELGLAAVAQDQGPGGARAGLGEVAGLLGGAGQELGLEPLGAGGAQVGAGDRLGEVAGVGAGGGELAAVGGEVGVEDGLALAEGGDGSEGAGAQAVARALRDERALPSGVAGPRLRAPFARAVSARVGLRARSGRSGVGKDASIGPASGGVYRDFYLCQDKIASNWRSPAHAREERIAFSVTYLGAATRSSPQQHLGRGFSGTPAGAMARARC